MSYLRQSTTANVSVGPFVRSANGFTLMPSLNIPATAVYLSKNGSILNAKSEASSAVYDKNGFYVVRLNGTDTNTVGDLGISINSASALPVWKQTFQVLPRAQYDAIVAGTRYLTTYPVRGSLSSCTRSSVTDKTGYSSTAVTVSDKTGYSIVANSDKSGYGLSRGQLSSVTATAIADKTGYSVTANSDKSGYGLSRGQLSSVTATVVSDKTGYSVTANRRRLSLFHDASVYVDATVGSTGTAFPVGTRATPSNSLTNRIAIAATNKLKRITVNVTTASYPIELPSVSNVELIQRNTEYNRNSSFGLSFSGRQTVSNVKFIDGSLKFSNIVSYDVVFNNCVIDDVNFIPGSGQGVTLSGCMVKDVIVLCNVKPKNSHFSGCYFSNAVDASLLTSINTLNFVDVKGYNLTIVSMSAGTLRFIDFNGMMTIDSSCTGGNILFSGGGGIVTNNGSNVSVSYSGFYPNNSMTRSVVMDKSGYSLSRGQLSSVTAATILDKTGYSISANSDKTGYSLSAGRIDLSSVTRRVVLDKTGYSVTADTRQHYSDGVAYYNTDMLYSGTAYPVGNATHPVNNAGDLLGILSANNLNRISVRSRLSFGSSGLTGTTVTNSTSYYKNKLTADDDAAVFLNDKFQGLYVMQTAASASFRGCSFEKCFIDGVKTQACDFNDCDITTLKLNDLGLGMGIVHNCTFGGHPTIDSALYGGVIDLNGVNSDYAALLVTNSSGIIGVINGVRGTLWFEGCHGDLAIGDGCTSDLLVIVEGGNLYVSNQGGATVVRRQGIISTVDRELKRTLGTDGKTLISSDSQNLSNTLSVSARGSSMSAVKAATDRLTFDSNNNVKSVKNASDAATADFGTTQKASIRSMLSSVTAAVVLDKVDYRLSGTKKTLDDLKDFDFTGTTIDGVPLSYALQIAMAAVNGKFYIDNDDVTFYKRDNITPLTVVHTSLTGRSRTS